MADRRFAEVAKRGGYICVHIAANGIETPRLLLYAANDRNPRGIANSSDQVGRNMMDHPGIHMGCVTKEPMWTGHGPVQQSSIVDFRDGPFRSKYCSMVAVSLRMADRLKQAMKT